MSRNGPVVTAAARHVRTYGLFMAAFASFFLLAGGGVDFGRAWFAEGRLAAAVGDAAESLAPLALKLSAFGLQREGERRMAWAVGGFEDPRVFVTASPSGADIRVNAGGAMPTAFLRLFNRGGLAIEATATATTTRRKLRPIAET
jgi:hypothetical protein